MKTPGRGNAPYITKRTRSLSEQKFIDFCEYECMEAQKIVGRIGKILENWPEDIAVELVRKEVREALKEPCEKSLAERYKKEIKRLLKVQAELKKHEVFCGKCRCWVLEKCKNLLHSLSAQRLPASYMADCET